MIQKDLSEPLSFVQEAIRVALINLPSYYPKHWHSFPEIIASCNGELDIIIDNKSYHLKENQFALIPPRKLHSIENVENSTVLVIQFSNDSLPRLHDFVTNRHILYLQETIDNNDFSNHEIKPIDILYKIKECYFSNIAFKEFHLYRELLQFFIVLGNYNFKLNNNLSTEKRNQNHYKKFNSVAKYIDEHYASNISLDEVSSYAGFSKYHFSRIFKEYFEISFPEYVMKQRVKHAIELLEDPNNSILNAALLSGFSSPSSFNRVFKQIMHCTPSNFRKMYNGFPLESENNSMQ